MCKVKKCFCRPPLAGRQSPLSSHGRASLAGEFQPRLYHKVDQLYSDRSPESFSSEESEGDSQSDSEESEEVREQQVLAIRQHEEVSQHGLRTLSQFSVPGDRCDGHVRGQHPGAPPPDRADI